MNNFTFLEKQIEQKQEKNQDLEVLIRLTGRKTKRKILSALEKFGHVVQEYEFLPYLGIQCSPQQAQLLHWLINPTSSNQTGSGNRLPTIPKDNLAQKIGYENLRKFDLSLFESVEAASSFSILPAPPSFKSPASSKKDFWNLKNIGVYQALQKSQGEQTKVAILDTGLDYKHPEIRSIFQGGADFVGEGLEDHEGHGTHVAGTTAGQTVGIARSSQLYSLKVLNRHGSGSELNIIKALEWAIKNEIDICNLSLGAPQASFAFEQACRLAYDHGLILVAAAGNEGFGPNYPASFDQTVIAVTAVDKHNQHAHFSNIYSTNDLAAPGVSIFSAYPEGGYKQLNGTSMAAPHVTGSLALVIQKIKNWGSLDSLLADTSQPLENHEGYDDHWVYGQGLVRADHLVDSLFETDSLRSGFLKNFIRRYA